MKGYIVDLIPLAYYNHESRRILQCDEYLLCSVDCSLIPSIYH